MKVSDRVRKNWNSILPLALIGLALGLGTRTATADEYTVHPEDVLSIQVTGEPKLSQNYTVDDKGNILMDTAGELHVAGLTPKQAEDTLTQQLKKYLKLFEVHVSVVGETGGRVLVFGEVAKPGSVKVKPDWKLLDVLAEAGQPNANADSKHISIIRKTDGKSEVVDLNAAIRDPAQNPPVFSGDTITVPARINYTVQVDGEVKSPGLRTLDQYKTAYAAVMSADPNENADWQRIALRHKDSSLPLIVDLSQVRTGQLKDDLELQPGDQITVMSRYRGAATLRGEVKAPGEKPLTGRTQLLDLIRIAGGGFTENADPTAVEILRDGQPNQKINLDTVASGSQNSDDPKLEVLPGDVIFVPNNENNRFAIIGGVRQPGAYRLKTGMSLIDAIFAAQGFSQTATQKQIIVAPDNPSDERFKSFQTANGSGKAKPSSAAQNPTAPGGPPAADSKLFVVDYKKVLSGEQNIALRPGDRILVPEEFPRQPKAGILDSALRLLPFASLFLIRR
jgi:protein involved in polysaccharide export with SLBB domain